MIVYCDMHFSLRTIILVLVTILAFSACASSPNVLESSSIERSARQYFSAGGIPELPSTAPKLYFSPEEWSVRALHLVESAEDYILISSFLINYHDVNSPIMEALAKKAAGGVRVYLLFDSSSYFTNGPDKISFLPTPLAYFNETPVHVAEYNPISGVKIFSIPSLLDRDHRKFWIVDGKYLAAGGMNLNYESLATSGKYRNIDTFAEIEGAEPLAIMVRSFCETWNRYSPETIASESFRIRESGTDSSIWLIDQIPGEGSEVNVLFDAFFQCAEKELWMIQAFTFATPALVGKIEAATKRGVKVHILLSANSFRLVHDEAAKYCIEDLLKAGAKVYMFDSPDGAFLHYKLLLADGSLAAFGSPNYNLRSQYLSREIALVSADPEVGAAALGNLRELMEHAEEVTAEEAAGYRGVKYFLSYLGMLIGG